MSVSKSNLKAKIKKVMKLPLKVVFWPLKKVFAPKNEFNKVRTLLLVILVLAIIAGFFDYPRAYNASVDWINNKAGVSLPHFYPRDYRLGLDLLGGTHLVYQADLSNVEFKEKGDAMEGVRDVIERRVNSLGVSEPVIHVLGVDRLVAELAGIKDVNEAIMKIGETPLLEFKEQQATEDSRELTQEQEKELKQMNAEVDIKVDDIFIKLKDGEVFEDLAKQYSDDEATKESGGDWGWHDPSQINPAIYEKLAGLEKGEVLMEAAADERQYQIFKLTDTRKEKEQVKASHLLICYKDAQGCENELTKEEAKAKIEEIRGEITAENFAEKAAEFSTEPGAAERKGDLGFVKKGIMVPEFEEALFMLQDGQISDPVETDFGYHLVYRESHELFEELKLSKIVVNKKIKDDILPPLEPWKNTDLSGAQLDRSQLTFDQQTGEVQVNLTFDKEGKKMFKEITERNIGKPVAIFLDSEIISAPRVNEVIPEGNAVITGNFTIPEGKQLVQRLNAGALPVPIELISQQTVGASLGQKSIQRSLFAGIIGLIFVCVFMVLYYRLPGLVAVVALLIYGAFTLALFKLIGVTLTLSGIAGFILSIGMAVDANVLIFERFREELRTGKTIGAAIDEGFKRAWTSIRDGNLSTIITCVILAWFGTSFIKGFAITLVIGVLISMFSAIFVTKNILRWVITTKLRNYKSLYLGYSKKLE